MAYEVRFDAATRIVETTYAGLITVPELQAAILQSLALADAHETFLFLGDCRTLEPGGSLFDIYDIVSFLESVLSNRVMKEAILLPQDLNAQSEMRFYETVSRNRWFDVRVFFDQDTAVAWLMDKEL